MIALVLSFIDIDIILENLKKMERERERKQKYHTIRSVPKSSRKIIVLEV